MIPLLAAAVAITIAWPHVARLERLSPAVAAAVWMSALLARALVGLAAAVAVVLVAPRTELFVAVTGWCLHTVLPLLSTHIGVSGHQIGHWATTVPALAFVGSALGVTIALVRAAHAVRQLVQRGSLGDGPDGSVIVGGPQVTVAAAGFARPRLLVSVGALTALDDAELAAGFDHERGHIAHRHRFILFAADLCRALGFVLPGGRRAVEEVAFHLERDADRYALRRNSHTVLASAICKAAGSASTAAAASALGGGVRAPARIRLLLRDAPGSRLGASLLAGAAVLTATAAVCAGLVLLLGAGAATASSIVLHASVVPCRP